MELTTYYTEKEIADILEACEITAEELADILELDFLDEGEPAPKASDLTYHIEYQQTLADMADLSEDEHELGIRWSEHFA